MALLNISLNIGALRGSVYTFEQVGDKLPMHSHDDGTAHITVVARGRVRCHNEVWSVEGAAGDVWDLDAGQHEFIALEANSRIVNIIKGVAP